MIGGDESQRISNKEIMNIYLHEQSEEAGRCPAPPYLIHHIPPYKRDIPAKQKVNRQAIK